MDNDLGKRFNETCKKLVLGEKPKSQASRLVDLVMSEDVTLFHTPEQEAYAEIQVMGHRESWPIRSKAFRRWIVRQFYEETQTVPRNQAVQDALLNLEGYASYQGKERMVQLRMAEQNGAIYLDLCDEYWRVVRILPSGWEVLNYSPIAFRRTKGMQPLPLPERGGSLEDLRTLLNVTSEKSWTLMVAWLMAALRPRGPYPVLVLHGEQGVSKSWTGKALRSFVDPNLSGLRGEPRDCRDLMIAANNGWIIAFDNLSRIEPWLSDGLCRLATGGGLATRELYSDADETILDAQRPLLLTSIEEVCTRGDLLDRSIIIQLEPIPDERRREEEELGRELDRLRPAVLGALLDGVVAGLANLHRCKLARLPRMADFARWVAAAESGLGWKPDTFMGAYLHNREQAHEIALEASSVTPTLQGWFVDRSKWIGTASELLKLLTEHADEAVAAQRGWPKTAKGLADHLRRLAPNLRAVGLNVAFKRDTTAKRTRTITLERVGFSSSSASAASEPTTLRDVPVDEGPTVNPTLHPDEGNLNREDLDDWTQPDAEMQAHSSGLFDEEVIDLAN